ncbi:MAG: hypothetical protein VXY53_08645, partial [Candidatus Thermoplasmatota archaeon]|nr:hypothetical protein [Candidatus Thermoplasmatota archaeon]
TVSNDEKVSKTDRMKKISPEWQVLSKWDNSRWNKDSKQYQDFIKSDEYDKKSFKKEIKYWTDFRSKNLDSFLRMKDDYDEKSSASESEAQEKSLKSSSTKKKASSSKKKKDDISAPPGAPGGGIGPALEEEVEADSFRINDELEPRIWDGMKMKEEIREPMLKIARNFIEGLPIDVKVEDITLTGSLANYN